jgi:hypothetical protein
VIVGLEGSLIVGPLVFGRLVYPKRFDSKRLFMICVTVTLLVFIEDFLKIFIVVITKFVPGVIVHSFFLNPQKLTGRESEGVGAITLLGHELVRNSLEFVILDIDGDQTVLSRFENNHFFGGNHGDGFD